MFEIPVQLKNDCFIIGRFRLSSLLLMNDTNYPWFILLPERENTREIFELGDEDQSELMKEISFLSKNLSEVFNADKINIAALGNVVHQLHIHVIVRYKNDAAWAGPVWGKFPAVKYSDEEKNLIIRKLKSFLPPEFEYSDQFI